MTSNISYQLYLVRFVDIIKPVRKW